MRIVLLSTMIASLAALGCSKTAPVAVLDAGREAEAPLASARPDAASRPGPPSAEARSAALKNLDEGRRFSRAKDWSKALDAFDRALTVMPDDARILSEVGWAALQANRLDRAEEANARALANAKEPLVRAPILYNIGRVAEARGKPEVARKAYKDSLALRSNAEVKRRLEQVVDAGGDSAPDSAGCKQGFPDILALCRCLGVEADDGLFRPKGSKFNCGRMSTKPLGDGRFAVVKAGGDEVGGGETAHLLVVHEAGKWRWLENLGSDFEPGAFGVHNQATVLGGESRNVAGHTVVIVRSAQDDNDFNMAGLELCEYHAKLDVVCAFGEGAGETKCTPPIPTEATSACGPNMDLDTKDADESTREALRDIKKTASSRSVKTSYTIGDDGKVTVTIESGTPDLIGADVKNPSPLWK